MVRVGRMSHTARYQTCTPFPSASVSGGESVPELDPVQESRLGCREWVGIPSNEEEGAMAKRIKKLEAIEIVHPNAAGLDIGAEEIWACAPPDREGETVKPFGTFTPDLNRLADWLVKYGVDTVAMESTGVYWVPIFEILEARGLKVYLVNARHMKTVPGRKSDVQDCQWIQKLNG